MANLKQGEIEFADEKTLAAGLFLKYYNLMAEHKHAMDLIERRHPDDFTLAPKYWLDALEFKIAELNFKSIEFCHNMLKTRMATANGDKR